MYKLKNRVKFILILISALICYSTGFALPKDYNPDSKEKGDELQRTYNRVFDLQTNTVSNIQFYTTNYGIFGLNIDRNEGGGVWPRGSLNQYIFGGGIWFAAIKNRPDGTPKKYCEISYNPNNGRSWMVPGRIEDGTQLDQSDIKKYRTFFSTDFRRGDGKPLNPDDGSNWPIWDTNPYPDTLKVDRYFGHYVYDENTRNLTSYPKGPAFISGEDIFATFKDTDLNYYDGGYGLRAPEGYPLKLQFEQMIYSWGFGEYRDFIFIKYDIINKSDDNLLECWMAPVMDIDIARRPLTQAGAANDRVRYYDEDPSKNLAIQWTNGDQGEQGNGFGYLGFKFLESPAVDNQGWVRKDKRSYTVDEQLGLKTFRNWNIADDPNDDDQRYNFLSSRRTDGDDGPGDKRFMMATGPFNIRPGDTVRVVVGMILAAPAVKSEADGSKEDVQGLIAKADFAQQVYDNNFRAPSPPDRSVILNWEPLNNAIKITWDSTAEISSDFYERGMDFMGYRLYRARRTNLDTFDVDKITQNAQYSLGKGPFGWKQIASWQMVSPFLKSVWRAGLDQNNTDAPFIDSMRIVGPVLFPQPDSFAIKVMRVGRGVKLAPERWVMQAFNSNIPVIGGIDTALLSYPWNRYYAKFMPNKTLGLYHNPFVPNPTRNELLDSVLIGTIYLNRALLLYNPLLWKKETVNILPGDTAALRANPKVGQLVYLLDSYKNVSVNNTNYLTVDRMYPIPPDVAMRDTNHVRAALDSIYSYIRRGLVKSVNFPDFEQSEKAKNEVIIPYMRELTNNRTFYDIGDDNRNAEISYDDDPTKTEKLLNNVDYYYKILAYDEGDYYQPTPSKLNDAFPGLPNLITAYPRAASVGEDSKAEIVYIDSAKIGGLYNFKFFPIDQERFNQEFAGHTLELEFQPRWDLARIRFLNETNDFNIGFYYRRITLKDSNTNKILFDGVTMFEENPCRFTYSNAFTEDAKSWYFSSKPIVDTVKGDSITFMDRYNREVIQRTSFFSSGDFGRRDYCYAFSMIPPAYGTLGFSFNYSMQQYGGMLRPDSSSIRISYNKTPINLIDADGWDTTKIFTTQLVDFETFRQEFLGYSQDTTPVFQRFGRAYYASFNNGPATYRVKFTKGGVEPMTLVWGRGTNRITNRFNVPYLNVEIENVISYKRPTERGVDSVPVKYPGILEHYPIDTVSGYVYYPKPTTLGFKSNEFINKYNLSAYAWVNGRQSNRRQDRAAQQANIANVFPATQDAFVGTQGRYYLSAISEDGKDTVDFTHVIILSGCQFTFDYANKGGRFANLTEWERIDTVYIRDNNGNIIDKKTYAYGDDFKEGEEVTLKVIGGALGLPLPGAKVKARISPIDNSGTKVTDSQMDKIRVVPNPFYISHQGVKSPYDTKIYFTKLPKRCTIDIYTATGDLIRSLEHDEFTSPEPDKAAVEVWDLLSKNQQRVQSQTMIAVIKAPNGAQTVQKFTVVVGGFRLIPE